MASVDMNEVVTRGILREELAKEREWTREVFATKLDLETWAGAIVARMDQLFREQRELIRQDMDSALRMVHAQFSRDLALALEPTKDLSERVAALENADLPARVSKLERSAASREKRTRRTPR